MDPRWRHPYGLRPTLRHLMILVVYFALIFALVAPLRDAGLDGWISVLVPLSPPLLALLVVLFERASPAKLWFAGLLLALTPVALLIWFHVTVVYLVWRGGVWGGPVGLILFNVGVLVALSTLARGLARRLPRRCPECGFRAALPLGGRHPRLVWCASCGHQQRLAADPNPRAAD
jgi:hypothetical protein